MASTQNAKGVAGIATLDIAKYQGTEVFEKNINEGVLAKISGKLPELKIGSTDFFVFDTAGGVELVGENGEKAGADHGISTVTAKTYKIQKTIRLSDELKNYDETEMAGVIDNIASVMFKDVSRALDLLAIHGINPATGEVSSLITNYLTKSGNDVQIINATANAEDDIVNAAGKLLESGKMATAVAFDPKFVGELAKTKDKDGHQKYPELGLGFQISSFQGLPAVSSDTVSARREMGTKASVGAVMGDFANSFKWGIAKDIELELIEHGDPDGKGDLKRYNQIAIRAEAYIGFAFGDPAAFAVVKKAAM